MHYGEDSIQRIKALTKKAKREKNAVLAKFLETKESLIPSLRDNLIKTYFTAYQFTYLNGQPLLYNNYRARIEELHAELKKSEEFRQNSIKIMDALRLFENSKKITSGVLKKHKKVRAAESTVELLQLLEPQNGTEKLSKSEEMNFKWKKIISQIELDMNTAIAKRTISQPNAVSFNSLTLIAELENMIFKTIDSGKNITSKILDPRFVITKTKHFSVISLRDTIAEMRNIYREYRQIFGSSMFNSSYYQYPMAFLCAGDISGALARVNAFDAVLAERNETPDALGRCVAALVKSLHGDYADLLALQKEASEIAAERNAERKKVKEDAHTARLSSICSTRTERAAEEAARLREKQKTDERRVVKMQGRTQAVFAVRNDHYYDDAISTAQSKAGKRQRHKEAQRKKVTEAEAAYEDSFSTDKKLSASASDTSESDNEISASKLSELYSLRGTALAVNDKIESGSWDFTRHDLVAYYEAMGCEKRSGKGSHEVIEFANSFMFSKDGEVITVLSDFGGALTLPRWEDTVPYYLRKQIQVAQEKLTRLAQKATHGLAKG